MKFFLVVISFYSTFSVARNVKLCTAVCSLSSPKYSVIAYASPYPGFQSLHNCFGVKNEAVNRCLKFRGTPRGDAFSCHASSVVKAGIICNLSAGKYVLQCEDVFNSSGLERRCNEMGGSLEKNSIKCEYLQVSSYASIDQCL